MPRKVRKKVRQLELFPKHRQETEQQNQEPNYCWKPHPEFGFGLPCRLPIGHDGAHSSVTGPDEHWF